MTYDMRKEMSTVITNCGVAPSYGLRQSGRVLNSTQLLARLEEKKVRNVDIARALGLPDSRIPEIKRKQRKLTLDEGARLVEAFGLEPSQLQVPLPHSIVRLVVRYIALELAAQPSEARIEEIATVVRAFSEFVSDPKHRSSVEAAEAFFEAMRLMRPPPAEEARQETDPDLAE